MGQSKGCLPQILLGPFSNTSSHILFFSKILIKKLILMSVSEISQYSQENTRAGVSF